jgi:hypothetical protein
MNIPANAGGMGLSLCLGIALGLACADEPDPGRQFAQLTNAGDACMSCLLKGDPAACKGVCSIGSCPEACSECLTELANLDSCAERGVCPLDGECSFPTLEGDHWCWADRTCTSLIDDASCRPSGDCEHRCADCLVLEKDASKCESVCVIEPDPCLDCLRESGGDWTACVDTCPYIGSTAPDPRRD